MKIAIIGYGKMGKTIERLALQKGHEIVLKVDINNIGELTALNLQKADVAIEFSHPKSAFYNVKACLEAGIPIVSGTTAWLDKMKKAQAICRQNKGAFIYASNYSIGVNIFFALNRFLAKMMNGQPQYDIEMEEIHHTEKLDAPSGTAISLAEDILQQVQRKTVWVNEPTQIAQKLPIFSKRLDKVPGTHQISYISPIDSIEIKHTAHSRVGFASGAILAAEWIIGKQGCFGMGDVLGLK